MLLPTDLISLSQAAKLLPPRHGKRVHTATVYRWCKRGRLTAYQCNGLRVSETELRSRFRVRMAFGTGNTDQPAKGGAGC